MVQGEIKILSEFVFYYLNFIGLKFLFSVCGFVCMHVHVCMAVHVNIFVLMILAQEMLVLLNHIPVTSL
jgi:hypothetical protein